MTHCQYEPLKMTLDWLFALLVLILLLPLLLLLCLLVRLDSPGPALYRQVRVGRGGRPFTLYKLRSMKIGTPVLSTEEMTRQSYDPYTRTGRFLRRSSLDELPQLLNILKGEMSFIGPRPSLPTQTDLNELREAWGVHAVRPGITGLAQVRGRDDLDTETKARYDAEYCRRISPATDLHIALQTAAAVFTGRGNR
jgi:lipopolysaccharide/colanic/teichoic acid biosynthesis glycosyltransferase